MRDKEQWLRWAESLSAEGTELGQGAMVVHGDEGSLAVPFSAIDEILKGSRLKPFALLPEEFCGVVVRATSLYPIIDVGGDRQAPAKIVLVRSGTCTFGLRFFGTPTVVDLDTVNTTAKTTVNIEEDGRTPSSDARLTFPLIAASRLATTEGEVLLLDVEAIAKTLQEQV